MPKKTTTQKADKKSKKPAKTTKGKKPRKPRPTKSKTTSQKVTQKVNVRVVGGPGGVGGGGGGGAGGGGGSVSSVPVPMPIPMPHSFATFSMGHPVRVTQMPDGSVISNDFGGRKTDIPDMRPVSTQPSVHQNTMDTKGAPPPYDGSSMERVSSMQGETSSASASASVKPDPSAKPGPSTTVKSESSAPSVKRETPMELFEAGHQNGVPIQPRVKSEGTSISSRMPKRRYRRREESDEVAFGTSVPPVTMFDNLPQLGPGYFDAIGTITPSERQSFEEYTEAMRNIPGSRRNPAGSLTSTATAGLLSNLEIAKGKQPAAIAYDV
jgi:hypothetical protein